MKSKLFVVFTIPVVVFIFFILPLFNMFFYTERVGSLWIYNSFLKKDSYANSIESAKIVFTSGSNTLYGVNTIDVEEELGIPTVNMAIHGGLKTDYILYRAKQVLNSGDIVILPFEYQNLTWNGEVSDTQRDFILTYDKAFFINNKKLLEKAKILFSITPLVTFKSLVNKAKPLVELDINVGYNSITQNINGDETHKNGNKSDLSKTKPFELPNKPFIETRGLKEIVKFSKWCSDNNIKLLVTFPNTINYAEYYKLEYQEYFNYLYQFFSKNNVEVLARVEDSLFDVKYFYDTNYHMNTEGAEYRTNKIIAELKIILEKDK